MASGERVLVELCSSTHIRGLCNKTVLSIRAPRVFVLTETTVVPHVDNRLADGMRAGELHVDPVSRDAEYFGAGEIGDCQGIVDRGAVDEIEGLLVCAGKEEDEGRESGTPPPSSSGVCVELDPAKRRR